MLQGNFFDFAHLTDLFNDFYFLSLLLGSYLLGSVPFGLLIGKIFYGADVRQKGSKNIGATNVMRTLGKLPGVVTFLLDTAKSFFAAFLGWYIFGGMLDAAVLASIACIIGHTKSIFLKFKGGKGVASLASFLLAFDLRIYAISALTWLVVFFISRTSGVAAILSLILCPISFLYFFGNSNIFWMMTILCFYLLVLHSDNIKKMFTGKTTKSNN